MDDLTTYRNQIDAIDERLMALLDQRYDIVAKIGQLKATDNTPVLDTNRETQILNKTVYFSHSPQIQEVFKSIMRVSKSIQRK